MKLSTAHRLSQNFRTGLKFTFPIRSHQPLQPSSRAEQLMSLRHFPKCLLSRNSFTHLMKPLHQEVDKEEKSLHDTSLFKQWGHATLLQCRLREQLAGTAHPQDLALPTCTQCKHRDFLLAMGNFTISVSTEDAVRVVRVATHWTHKENWERGWSQGDTKDCYLSRSLGCATQSPTVSSSGLKWELSGGLYWVVWVFKFIGGRGYFWFCFFFFFVNIDFKTLPSLLRRKAWAGKQLGNLQHTQVLRTPLLNKKANLEIKEKEKKDYVKHLNRKRSRPSVLLLSAFYYLLLPHFNGSEVVQIPHHKHLFIYKTVYTYTLYT